MEKMILILFSVAKYKYKNERINFFRFISYQIYSKDNKSELGSVLLTSEGEVIDGTQIGILRDIDFVDLYTDQFDIYYQDNKTSKVYNKSEFISNFVENPKIFTRDCFGNISML